MNGNRKQSEPSAPSYRLITSCFTECEDIAFSLMAAAKGSKQKRLFEKLYESFKYSDKVSDDGPFEADILYNITGFSRALAEGQYELLSHEELEHEVNEFISRVAIRNKRLLESKRGAY